jgi:hypothetical protein
MEEYVSLFVALADVYDAACSALNDAKHVSIAVPIALTLKLEFSTLNGDAYPGRLELLRLHHAFDSVAASSAEFEKITKDGKACLDKVVAFVERVCSAHATNMRTPEHVLRKAGGKLELELPVPQAIAPL